MPSGFIVLGSVLMGTALPYAFHRFSIDVWLHADEQLAAQTRNLELSSSGLAP